MPRRRLIWGFLVGTYHIVEKSGIPGVFIAHGLSRWRHGFFRNAPVSRGRGPGGDTVAPGVVPVYHGIWQPSRLLQVSSGCFKHFTTTGDISRFNTVHPGSPKLSTVPPRLWHGLSRIIKPGWTGTLNRDSENGALARINVSCTRAQRNDAGEARTRGPSVSSQALYHWATALRWRSTN